MVGDKFMENCAIILMMRGSGFESRNLGGFFLGKGVPKIIFRTALAKPAA
jgi:hypothetical protein